MRRRGLSAGILAAVALGLIAALSDAAGQQDNIHRIGVFAAASPRAAPQYVAFEQRLRQLGYVEGRNLAIEFRTAEGRAERMPELAAELVRLAPDLIVAVGSQALIGALQQASHGKVPIVMVAVDFDPVAAGFVTSLARPGGNITGVFVRQPELAAKRLELLRELVPAAALIAVLWDALTTEQLTSVEATAGALGVQLQPIKLRDPPYDFDGAFAAAAQAGAGAVLTPLSPAIFRDRARLVDAALRSRLPVMFASRELAEAGGLISYGANLAEQLRRAATYVDEVLKGTSPAGLPIELAASYELVVHLRTAKALDIVIPQSILLRADEVIE